MTNRFKKKTEKMKDLIHFINPMAFSKLIKLKFFSFSSPSSTSSSSQFYLQTNSKVYGFDSGLNQYLINNDQQDFIVSDDPVWLLGKKYSTIDQLKELQDDFRSKIWITYRKNFSAIGGNGPTSDQGWGCMARCGRCCFVHLFNL